MNSVPKGWKCRHPSGEQGRGWGHSGKLASQMTDPLKHWEASGVGVAVRWKPLATRGQSSSLLKADGEARPPTPQLESLPPYLEGLPLESCSFSQTLPGSPATAS